MTSALPYRSPRVRRTVRALIALLAALTWSGAARAQEAPPGGLLLAPRGGGESVEAVRLGTDFKLAVSGPTVRAKVTQAFRNTTGGWVEAIYVHPLPEDGAVDSLTMVVGDRIVVGEIKRRAEARAVYEAARAEGRKAGLLEQQRANVFTTAVANIGPGETVLVQIEYQAPARLNGGTYSLRAPLVVAPRYSPERVADRQALESPVLAPRVYGRTNPVSISVDLQPGFRLGAVTSTYHAIRNDPGPHGGRRITLADQEVPADRDFELTWRPALFAAPDAGLFSETVAGETYVLATVSPPTAPSARDLPREVVFVIDNSGSMGGESMRQAKASLAYALSRLKPADRFNVVRFDDTLTVLFPDTVPADREHIGRAQAYVAGLEASGGTEMLPALKAALIDPRPGEGSRLRQVVFLTDGAIGDDQALIDEVARERGRSRVFMVGIGSAPNSFLMTRAAELGRGAFTHIGSEAEVEGRMKALFSKLESPAVTNLSIEAQGVTAHFAPALLPDVYRGEPLTIAARVSDLNGRLKIAGTVDGRPWSAELELKDAVPGRGISKLWARRRITDMEAARSLGQIESATADERIAALGLAHGMVTSQTSLVAVDRTPSRPAGAALTRADLPINLPAGWDFDALFAARTDDQGDPPAAGPAGTPESLDLPQTATDAELRLLAGLGLVAWGLLALAITGRRGRVR